MLNVIEISLKPGVQQQIDAALALRSSGHFEEALRALANASEYNSYLNTVRAERSSLPWAGSRTRH